MRNLITILLILSCVVSKAQFNTLVFSISEKEEIQTDSIRIENDEKERKRPLDFLFKKSEKKALKEQNDSLKALVDYFKQKTAVENNILLKDIHRQLIIKDDGDYRKSNKSKSFKSFELINDSEFPLSMPLNRKLVITSTYGSRIHPISGKRKSHNGVDLRADYEEVFSILSGVVVESGWDVSGGGNFVKIQHSDRFETAYLHLSQILCKPGDKIKSGDIIGISGNTGSSTGPHLHFAVKEYGRFINPISFLNQLINYNNIMSNHLTTVDYGRK